MTHGNENFAVGMQFIFTGFVLIMTGWPCFAQLSNASGRENLSDMSLEELLNVSIITSASRQPQRIGQLTVPISVITAEDIHYSGLTNLAEILQFAPGVDILKIDRLRYAVGIHGLHETLSDRTTLLIDGREADNPVYGGPDFLGLPLMLEDIERIEIIRSPESAAWGANALTGIINIVTKKPKDVPGVLGYTTISEFGDSYNYLRVAQTQDKWSWRVSGGYQNTESSDDAIDGSATYQYLNPALSGWFNNFHARDFARITRFDSEAETAVSEDTKFYMGVGHSHIESGDTEYGGYFPMKNIREDHIRSFTRLEHQFDDGTSAHLRWSGKFWNANWVNISRFDTAENEFEAQFDFPLNDNHLLSVGADFKWDHVRMSRDTPEQIYVRGSPFNEYTTGAFIIDRLRISERLTLEGQIRGETYSPTDPDWAGRLSALYALDSQRDHVLRFSVARAFRVPLIAIRKFASNMFEIAPSVYLFNLVPTDDLDNEKTTSLEAGYWGKLTDTFAIEAGAYYQRFDGLIGYRQTTDMLGQTFLVADNIDGADSWGAELQLTFKDKGKAFSAWYSYNGFEYDAPLQDLKAFLPSRHKAGLTGRLFLLAGWVVNAQYRFADTTLGNPSHGINAESSNRLDLAISKSFAQNKCEMMVGVQDILDKTHNPIAESIQFTGHETPGRIFFARLQFAF